MISTRIRGISPDNIEVCGSSPQLPHYQLQIPQIRALSRLRSNQLTTVLGKILKAAQIQ